MGHHTFPAADADRLEDAAMRYRHCSAEELLWALDPSPDDAVVDLGSGTGFFTDDVAPGVGEVYAVDVQEAMHDRYREKGVPENVTLVTSGAAELPFDGDAMDAAFATMTYHELPGAAVEEAARALRPGGRFVIVDWTADGAGASGPPVEERYDADHAAAALDDAGYTALSNTLSFTGLEVFFFMPHVWAGGGQLFNDDMTESLIDEQPAVDALEFFIELQEKGYSTDQTSSESFTYPEFNAEEASMAYTGSGIGNVKQNNEELYNNMGVAMFPKPEGGTQSSFLGGNTLTIPAQVQQDAEKFEAAKTFANWINTEEGMSTTVEQMGYLPARESGFELDFVQERWDIYSTFKRALTQGHAPPMHTGILEMQEPLNSAIQRALLGEQEPEGALSEAADAIANVLQG
jgi:ABC-type glycerol-3-phosphate transport system substrate-binding protein